jgi:hypothetical protein
MHLGKKWPLKQAFSAGNVYVVAFHSHTAPHKSYTCFIYLNFNAWFLNYNFPQAHSSFPASKANGALNVRQGAG